MMFSEWSNDLLPQQGWLGDEAAIGAFKNALPWKVSRDFVAGTAKHLAGGLSGGLSKPLLSGASVSSQRSVITHDKQLDILMPALGYGLSFPLSEVDVLRDCVTIYCDWLTAFLPTPKAGIPMPIVKDPNHYAVTIISHFYYVFVPRGGEGPDVNKQAVLCHRVLRTLQTVAQHSTSMTEETWHVLLLFLLHINSALLAPPAVKVSECVLLWSHADESDLTLSRTLSTRSQATPLNDDAGEQLCERVLGVLFETWLLACDKCFPPPPLWTALRLGCIEWRHRAGLVQQWGRICSALTSKLLHFMYGPKYKHNLPAQDLNIIPPSMSKDCIAQVWFRFLHILGNPVELSKETVISKTPAFLKFAISSQEVVEPCQHPCLRALPEIFLAAMKVVANLVDAFIGTEESGGDSVPGRAKVNSILHLFGGWLFEASLINTQLNVPLNAPHFKSESSSSVSGVMHAASTSTASGVSAGSATGTTPSPKVSGGSIGSASGLTGPKRPSSVYGLMGEGRKSSAEGDGAGVGGPGDGGPLLPSDFEAGRAEALGALCRIMCSAKTGEEILPVYLSRFYLAVREGLRSPLSPPHQLTTQQPQTPTQEFGRKTTLGPKSAAAGQQHSRASSGAMTAVAAPSPCCSPTAAAVLLNGADLLRIDLDGVVTLIPALFPVLTAILTSDRGTELSKQQEQQSSSASLRLAATNVLLSLLALPLHFQDLVVKEVGVTGERYKLSQLRPQLLNLLSTALQTETQPHTIHMLLGGLMFCVQDANVCESMDSVSQHNYPSSEPRDSNTPLGGGGDSLSSVYGGAELSSLTEESADDTDVSNTPTQLATGVSAHDCGSTLVVRAIYLVCHHLILSWRSDVNVSLAGLELLGALARLHPPHQDLLECKRAVKWLCDYIIYQCSRPPPHHSKDLHSTIVAAFQTCSVWLLSHPTLLHEQDTLLTLLEVIELGISGSKSHSKGGLIFKHEKQLKPVSLRVRDAAEALLSCVLSQVGRFPFSGGGAELVSSQLDEATLLQHCNTWPGDAQATTDAATKHFRYYVSQNSILLALLEQPLGNHQEPQPSVTAIVRGPFGRSVWCLQLRHLPRHRSASSHHTSNPGRPLPLTDTGTRHAVRQKFFPDSVDRIPQCNADKSIPTLESVIHSSETSSHNHEKLLQILDHQISFEEELVTKASVIESKSEGEGECVAPPVCQEFQTARLLLTHLGLLSVESLQSGGDNAVPELVELDSTHQSFAKDLEILDATNNRTVDTVHVFYVAAGQTSAQEILSNVTSRSSVSPHFLELVSGLGWSVSLSSHSGWGGRTKSLQQQYATSTAAGGECEGLSGADEVVYWCDAATEVAFVVPAPHQLHQQQDSQSIHSADCEGSSVDKSGDSLSGEQDGASSSFSSYASHSSQVSGRRFGRQSSAMSGHDHKVLVVWLESYADYRTFPTTQLLQECQTGLESPGWRDRDPLHVSVIFLHPLENGLYRVKLEATGNKLSVAGPLVSGQVVSRRVLGALVRQTALNMARRRRLDCDSYQPPHVRRKLRVQDMVHKYRYDMTEPEFYSHLFTSPLC